MQRWIRKNRAKHNARTRARYKNLPEQREYMRRYNREHPEACRAAVRKSYRKHAARRRREAAAWNRAHREVIKAGEHRRRARKRGAGGSWTAKQWLALLDRYGHRCLACGLGKVQLRCLRRKLVPDHVRPLSRGGRNDISNLQPLCHGVGGCNNSKGARSCRDYR